MNKKIVNYFKFLLSLIIMGFGIALVTKSNLGTSAISSIPYVLSKVFNLSFGTFTLIVNLFYFFVQLVVLRKDFPKNQYLQVVVGPVLGLFIDLSMFLLKNLPANNYLFQMIILFTGCFVVAFSIWLQLEANVVTNPTEGVVKLIASKTDKSFSSVKTTFDVFLVVLAISISLVGLKKIVGVREGTLISAFLVGYLIKKINYVQKEGKLC